MCYFFQIQMKSERKAEESILRLHQPFSVIHTPEETYYQFEEPIFVA